MSQTGDCCCFGVVGHAALENCYTIHVSNDTPLRSFRTEFLPILWSHLTIPCTYAFSHTLFSTEMSSSRRNLTCPFKSPSIATSSMEPPLLPQLIVISSSSQILKNFLATYCQDWYFWYLSTGMTKRWSIRMRGGAWGPGIALSRAVKLIPHDLSSFSDLHAPLRQVYNFGSIPSPPCKA